MPMYNLLEYSDSYSIISETLCDFYRDEIKDSSIENNDDGNKANNNKAITSKFFEYKTKIIGKTPDDNNTLDSKVAVPLKYLSNFLRFFDLPLINCEIELDLSWSKEGIISEISITLEVKGDNPVDAVQTTGETFYIIDDKIYVAVATFSINGNIKSLEKQGFKRTTSWNK